jgi:L-asparaginase
MQSSERLVVVLGTGGTIAGTAADAGDNVGYTAAQIGVAQLVAAIPPLAGVPIECEQVAQLDSKDMDHATWQRLAQRAAHHLARENVCGVVVTHGTDTMEETAYFLQRVLAPAKPLALTGAMRPATSLQADGPQNLLDAIAVAREPGARGATVVFAGTVHGALEVRKAHPYRLGAFSSGDAGPIAYVEEGRLRRLREWPQGTALGLDVIATDPATWPRVEIVTSHAGANGAIVDALVASGVKGFVVAGTGNGKVHRELQAALGRAQASGVRVERTTRCATGAIVAASDADEPPESGALSPAQARIALLLELLAARS